MSVAILDFLALCYWGNVWLICNNEDTELKSKKSTQFFMIERKNRSLFCYSMRSKTGFLLHLNLLFKTHKNYSFVSQRVFVE